MGQELVRVTTITEALTVAGQLAKAGYWKDERNTALSEAKIFAKIMLGAELGIGPLASTRGIEIDFKGRVTLTANLQAGLVQSSGKYDFRTIKADDNECEIQFLQRNPSIEDGKAGAWELIGTSKLTMQQARAAFMHQQWVADKDNGPDKKKGGYEDKHTWKAFPSDMLFARTMTRGVKRYCPSVTNKMTVYDPDELRGLAPDNAIEGTSRLVSIEQESQQTEMPTTTTAPTTAQNASEPPKSPSNGAAAGSSSGTTTAPASNVTQKQDQPGKNFERAEANSHYLKWSSKVRDLLAAKSYPESYPVLSKAFASKVKENDSVADVLRKAYACMTAYTTTTGEVFDPILAELYGASLPIESKQ